MTNMEAANLFCVIPGNTATSCTLSGAVSGQAGYSGKRTMDFNTYLWFRSPQKAFTPEYRLVAIIRDPRQRGMHLVLDIRLIVVQFFTEILLVNQQFHQFTRMGRLCARFQACNDSFRAETVNHHRARDKVNSAIVVMPGRTAVAVVTLFRCQVITGTM